MTQRIKTKLSIRAAPANPASPAWALAVFGMVLGVLLGTAAELPVPGRLLTAPTGSELAEKWAGLSVEEREQEIETEILNGNIPAFLRQLHPVILRQNEAGRTNWIQIYVARDYLAVGSDDDPLYAPMTPRTAQRIADRLGCSLPTPRIVDAIHRTSTLVLDPAPRPPGPAMTSVREFKLHSDQVAGSRFLGTPQTNLVAGHKKDVVLSVRLTNAPGRVAIYGWHRKDGRPIQPLYLGHSAEWVDYSHGIRLISTNVVINGRPESFARVLQTPHWCSLLSHEGLMLSPRYEVAGISGASKVQELEAAGGSEHQVMMDIDPAVRVKLVLPVPAQTNRPWRLVLYALPNGNTIEQTIGKRMEPGDDWHFGIQHIGAQLRFVRRLNTNFNWAIAYIEAEGQSWPAWRRKQIDASTRIQSLVAKLISRPEFSSNTVRLILAAHSGGGSLLFGYLDGVSELPEYLERIAFLDANYAYDPAAGHAEKLTRWLVGGTNRFLTVLAYHDSNALLDGRTFVSEAGGTWGRSHLMLTNFSLAMPFESRQADGLSRHQALQGRLQILLKANPDRKVLHTVQVERNGFIHSMLCGTPEENLGYTYFGSPAYERWIEP